MQGTIKYERASNGYIISTDKVKMVAEDMEGVGRILANEIVSAIHASCIPDGFIKIQIEPKKEDL